MKKLSMLKLNQLSKAELEKREMNLLMGGECCGCGCNGSSSTSANYTANYYAGYSQSDGGNKVCANWGDSSSSPTC
ncbi:MAG: TIGR04149 family rSAM-modified RiPP [Tannerella sp.]|jgi:natural product precursor|nr:TIGR04149 family rSAM-modified RiPP [Tannerella sp.]